MHEWFYRDAAGRQLGPIGREELAYLHRQGVIREDTPVWHAGIADWSTLAAAGQVPGDPLLPPPLPNNGIRTAAEPVAPPPAPKPRLSGCAIAIVAALGLVLLFGLPTIGILAAIALPAYQDYTVRSKVTHAQNQAAPVQQAIDAWFDTHGQCPDDAWLARQPGGQTETIARMTVGRGPAGRCSLTLLLTAIHADIDGTTLLLESTPSGWRCVGGSLPQRYLPPSCKTDQGLATP